MGFVRLFCCRPVGLEVKDTQGPLLARGKVQQAMNMELQILLTDFQSCGSWTTVETGSQPGISQS